MHPDYSVTLQNGKGGDEQQDNSVPLRLALENFRDADPEEAKRQSAKNIGYAVISDIQVCDDFIYSCHRVNGTTEGYSLYFVCSSDLATQPSETNCRNKMRAGAIPRHGKFRLRVDCCGTVSIVVTTEAVTVNYKHRPIHEKAPSCAALQGAAGLPAVSLAAPVHGRPSRCNWASSSLARIR
jgi:hypothetical protein